MKNTIKHLVSLFLIYALNTAVYAEITVNSKSSLNYYERDGTLGCFANSSWVDNPSIPPAPSKPIITTETDKNCTFNQEAWQLFAYLTKNGKSQKPRFLEMMPKERVFKETPDPWDLNGDIQLIFSDILQAGSKKPLNDQNKIPIFYQQSINETFYNDIVSHQLNNSQCIDKIDSDVILRKHDIISSNAIEIKTSWKVLTSNDDASKFFTIYRNVMLNGGLLKNKQLSLNAQLALLGMHIVIKTPSNPEWIWMSFEHKGNAPACDKRQLSRTKLINWTLYNPKAPANFPVNKYLAGQPTQVCRETPYGVGVLEQAGLIKNIEELNFGMTKIYQKRSSVWSNYFLVGSAWTHNGQIPPTPNNETGGSRLLSNTSMETYVQNPKRFELEHPKEHRGCFACHNYDPNEKNALHLSHMFDAAKDYGTCMSTKSNFQNK